MLINISSLIHKHFIVATFACLLVLTSGYATSSDTYTSTPLILKVSKILAESVIKGSNYQIEEDVVNDGLINIYSITSEYGEVEAEGTIELHIRVAEFHAISVMEEMDRSDIFGEALGKGLMAPVKGVAALVTEPVETTKSAAKGLGQFFSNVGRAFVSDDPDQDNVAKVILGYDVAKRQFAYELGINPYTDNDLVREPLGKISRAAVAGGLVPRAAMAAIDSTAITIARVTGTTHAMKELVRDNSPGKLDKINRKKLEAMGVSSGLTESFLDNYTYDPYEETLLVGELEFMERVKGRDKFITVATGASEVSVARYYRAMAQMMGAYHTYIDKVKEIRNIRGILHLYKADGTIVILSPVDYVFWTKRLADRLTEFESQLNNSPKKEIWITGQFDEQARAQFENAGWKVIENAEDTLLKDI